MINPNSRLIPVGANALFTCKFRNVLHPYWKINKTEASNVFNKDYLRMKGFFIDQVSPTSDGIVTLTLTVNGSYDGVNNTRIECKTQTPDVASQAATIFTIAGILLREK